MSTTRCRWRAIASSSATDAGWDAVRTRHLNDFQPRMARVDLSWGADPAASVAQLPTDLRRKAYASRPHRHRPGADDVPVRSLPAGQLLAPRRPAGQSAGAVERQQQPGLGQRLPQQHQRPDELLGRRADRPRRVPPAADRTSSRRSAEPMPHRHPQGLRRTRRRGWTARTSQSIFGGNGWQWNIPASAWYAQHLCGALRLHAGPGLPAPTRPTRWSRRSASSGRTS